MFSANITNRDPAEILLKNTADREFPLSFLLRILAGYDDNRLCTLFARKVELDVLDGFW